MATIVKQEQVGEDSVRLEQWQDEVHPFSAGIYGEVRFRGRTVHTLKDAARLCKTREEAEKAYDELYTYLLSK